MDEMTIGEISRSLVRLEKSQGEQTIKLDEIKSQTVKTNGFVGRHEERLSVLDREVRDLKRARIVQHASRRASDNHELITLNIPTNKKALTLMFTVAGGMIASAFLAAAKLMGLL